MLQNYNKKTTFFPIFFIFLLLTLSCAKKEDASNEVIFKKKRINPNIDERAREAANKSGDVLSRMRKNNNVTTYEFSTSNVLWRATLKSLDFMPLLAVDYAGGVIVTDWYGNNLNSANKAVAEEIKMTIRFLSNELSIASIDIKSFKKKCIQNNCSILPADQKLNNDLKNKIVQMARNISIEDEKKKEIKK